MACPAVCNSYGTGTSTCNGHRGACSTNDAIAWATASGAIYAGDVDSLRVALRTEIDAYNANSNTKTKTAPNTISAGQTIPHDDINNLADMVNQLYGSGALSKAAGDLITGGDWQGLIDRYNVLRQNCICNSDCSCNNICACYGDCGCNYSDIRLKENIEFIRVENGLNIYSWNYIWSTTKRFVGVMAQELLDTKYAYAVSTDKQGYYMVDYSRLPLKNILGEKYAINSL